VFFLLEGLGGEWISKIVCCSLSACCPVVPASLFDSAIATPAAKNCAEIYSLDLVRAFNCSRLIQKNLMMFCIKMNIWLFTRWNKTRNEFCLRCSSKWNGGEDAAPSCEAPETGKPFTFGSSSAPTSPLDEATPFQFGSSGGATYWTPLGLGQNWILLLRQRRKEYLALVVVVVRRRLLLKQFLPKGT